MPSGTTIQQFVNDLRDRKSTIAHAFDKVYNFCRNNPGHPFKATLVAALRGWNGSANTLPDLTAAGVTLSNAEKKHIEDWPDRLQVRNAMVRALEALEESTRDIVFFWDLSDEPAPDAPDEASHSVIEPPQAGNNLTDASGAADPGGTGNITVTFLSPRRNVLKTLRVIGGITMGGIKVEV